MGVILGAQVEDMSRGRDSVFRRKRDDWLYIESQNSVLTRRMKELIQYRMLNMIEDMANMIV
jgi:hypothetical protein